MARNGFLHVSNQLTVIHTINVCQGEGKKVGCARNYGALRLMRCDFSSKPYCSSVYLDFSKQWKEAALEMDNHLHFDEWKKVDEDPFYDWKLVRKVSSILIALFVII
jgi:hypothetical protein